MEYKTEGCSLTVPDTITVRDQLRYSSAVAFSFDKQDRLMSWWEGAKVIIREWKCEAIPDFEMFDPDKSTDIDHARIIAWAGSTCYQHMASLGEVPKK